MGVNNLTCVSLGAIFRRALGLNMGLAVTTFRSDFGLADKTQRISTTTKYLFYCFKQLNCLFSSK